MQNAAISLMLSPLLFSAIVCVRQILPDSMHTNGTNEMEGTWNWEFSSMVEPLASKKKAPESISEPQTNKPEMSWELFCLSLVRESTCTGIVGLHSLPEVNSTTGAS